jgi:hypothetical protein
LFVFWILPLYLLLILIALRQLVGLWKIVRFHHFFAPFFSHSILPNNGTFPCELS